MKTLIIGSGGREHTIGYMCNKSTLNDKLYFMPGNAGTSQIGENVNIDPLDFQAVLNFISQKNIDLVIVGPEQPLVAGITDFLTTHKPELKIIGPQKNAAKLEGSKSFAKQFMGKYNIPTAKYKTFDQKSAQKAFEFLETLTPPYVIKADGLAAGKGVVIIDNINVAKNQITNFFNGKFGDASKKIVIEQFLDGIELSVFIITDGKNYKILPSSKDYKRIGNNDTGLNTGGMGAVSPVPFADKNFLEKIENKIIKPTINGLLQENIKYTGFLYFGLMKVKDEPFVIEYNVRLGDPETQAVLPRLENDFLEMMNATATGQLNGIDLKIKPQTALTVVLASKGYPLKYEKNKPIEGLDKVTDALIFHAGTKTSDNQLITNGGRVLALTAFGDNIADAQKKVYSEINKIHFENIYYRYDIGNDLLNIKNK